MNIQPHTCFRPISRSVSYGGTGQFATAAESELDLAFVLEVGRRCWEPAVLRCEHLPAYIIPVSAALPHDKLPVLLMLAVTGTTYHLQRVVQLITYNNGILLRR
jgi:hypothetical protein